MTLQPLSAVCHLFLPYLEIPYFHNVILEKEDRISLFLIASCPVRAARAERGLVSSSRFGLLEQTADELLLQNFDS